MRSDLPAPLWIRMVAISQQQNYWFFFDGASSQFDFPSFLHFYLVLPSQRLKFHLCVGKKKMLLEGYGKSYLNAHANHPHPNNLLKHFTQCGVFPYSPTGRSVDYLLKFGLLTRYMSTFCCCWDIQLFELNFNTNCHMMMRLSHDTLP